MCDTLSTVSQVLPAVGAVAGIVGSNIQANAAGNAAQAQLSAQSALQGQVQSTTAPTANELMLQNQQMIGQQQNLARQQQLLAAVDPSLMEAGKQALAILQGQSAPTLGPLQQQLSQQRQSLIQSLTQQMGPGALTSSSGQAALRQFDMSAANTVAQQQQSYLGTLLGSAQTTEGQTNPLATIQSMQGTVGQAQNQQALQANALMGTSVTPYAGAPYLSSFLKGQGLTSAGNSATQLGMSNMSSGGTGGGVGGGGGGGAGTSSNSGELSSLMSTAAVAAV